jgi:hypothetical protein
LESGSGRQNSFSVRLLVITREKKKRELGAVQSHAKAFLITRLKMMT